MRLVALHTCPLCGGRSWRVLYPTEPPCVRCVACGLVFLNPQPRVEQRGFYNESYYRGTSEQKQAADNEDVLAPEKMQVRLESCQAVVDQVMQYVPYAGRWLDIGCGPGFLLSQAQACGWRCTGLDSSPFAPRFARERFGLEDVHSGLIEEADFAPERFDIISMQHVIEHLYDPLPTMRRVLSWLKPGGLLYLETPDIESGPARRDGASWLHIKIPEHVLYFSGASLRHLLAELGCEVLDVQHPVPGTGLMQRLCGGEEEARRFYNAAKKVPLFVWMVRRVRWLRQRQMTDVSEHMHVLARKSDA